MKPTSPGRFGEIIRRSPERTLYNAQMASSTTPGPESEEHLNARQRWISLAEVALGASIVILHNVYHRVPNEVPILFVLGWISIRLRNGGWKAVGLRKPDSWRKTILWGLAVGVLVVVAGELANALGERIWHTAAKVSSVIEDAKASWKTALASLGLVWTLAAFGEEMGYRGYLLTRAAEAGDRAKLADVGALLAPSILFWYRPYLQSPP